MASDPREESDTLGIYNYLGSRQDDRRFPGDARREDVDSELVRRNVRTSLPALDSLAKIVAVAGGAMIAGRAVGKDRIIKALHYLGSAGSKLDSRVLTPIKNMVDDAVLGTLPHQRGVAQHYLGSGSSKHMYRTPELVRELEVMYTKYDALGRGAINRLHGPHGTGVDIHREFLERRYMGRTAPSNLSHMTVGDILSTNVRDKFSDNSIKVLERARQHGVISNEFVVNRSDTFGIFKGSGRVYDTTMFSGKRLFDAAHDTLRKFSIAGMRPADLIFGAIRPMVFKADHTLIGNNTMLPNGVRTGGKLNFSLGGDVWSLADSGQFERIATNMHIYDISRPGTHFYGRALASMQGRVADQMEQRFTGIMVGRDQPVKHFWQRLQQLVGVGPEYQTNKSVFGSFVDAIKRHNIDQGTAQGKFVQNQYIPRSATMNWWDKIKAQSQINKGAIPYESLDQYMDEAILNPFHGQGAPNIPFAERVKALFGNSRLGGHYTSPPTQGWGGHKVGYVPNSRTPMQGYTPIGRSQSLVAGAGGKLTSNVPATGIVDLPGAGNAANLFMHHATERLNQLIGWTTGMGFRPSPGRYGWVGNLGKIYGMAGAAVLGLEAAKYTDYIAGEALDFVPGLDNKTPSQYAVSLYSGAMVARQKLREITGVQQLAKYAEGLMPGSTSLPGMTALRTLGPAIAGAWRGTPMSKALGAAGTVMFGGLDLDMSSQELSDIYAGRQKVPVMKSRGWMLGLQPFGGNEIDYYRHHWAARYQSNFRYTDTQFGSKGEYFAFGSPLPTPHNLFGVLKLLNPDYYAEKHYYNRPYPYSPSGERMHEGEEMIPGVGQSSYTAQALGYEPSPGTYSMGVNPTSASGLVSRSVDRITELGGIYKFFAESMPGYETVFGDPSDNPYAANASTITSGSRMFYDESVGGLLGMTELLRRYLDPNQGKQGINYIPNQMPNWLPGVRSMFQNDQDYYNDFTTGDPYARIQMGEARLPGPAYETLHRMHSGTPGVYDAMDRYLILADVAPYSEAFKNYRTIVQMWAASGALDKSWLKEFTTTEEQVRKRMDGPEFTPRRFTGVRSGTPEELATINQYSLPERVIGGTWETLTHDIVPAIGRAVPIWGTIADRKLFGQRSAYESFLEDQVYGTDFHNWKSPYRSFVRPRIQNLAASDPLTATAGGLGLGTVFGATPLGLAVGAMGGAGLGAFSAVRTAVSGKLRGGWIPSNFEDLNREEQYFDSLQYERASRNLALARQAGRNDLVNEFQFQMGRTAVGMNYGANDQAFFNAAKFRMGTPMKDYAWQFLQAPAGTRQAIMDVAPSMARPILSSAYNRFGDTRFGRQPGTSPGRQVQDNIAFYGMPSTGWAGWSPDIPMEAIKIKTLDGYHNNAYDMHRYDLWAADRRSAYTAYPNLTRAY